MKALCFYLASSGQKLTLRPPPNTRRQKPSLQVLVSTQNLYSHKRNDKGTHRHTDPDSLSMLDMLCRMSTPCQHPAHGTLKSSASGHLCDTDHSDHGLFTGTEDGVLIVLKRENMGKQSLEHKLFGSVRASKILKL